jgi:hypothetical protein
MRLRAFASGKYTPVLRDSSGRLLPAVDADPGRLRNAAFFTKMYGECKNSGVKSRLVNLAWLPNSWGQEIQIT